MIKNPETNSVREALRWGEATLETAQISNAKMEALWLLFPDEKSPSQKLFEKDEPLTGPEWQRYQKYIAKRSDRYPLAYLIGFQPFMDLDFIVNQHVLIPRPETETVIHEVLKINRREWKSPHLLDIGTGSGNIAISLAKKIPEAQITAIDVSLESLKTARKNSRFHETEHQISFVRMDYFSEERPAFIPLSPFDAVLSNPPYVKTGDLSSLQKEIGYEPLHALDGGNDGLEKIRPIIRHSQHFLKQGGLLIIEIGDGQSETVQAGMLESGWYQVKTVGDAAGIERVVTGRKP